MLSHARNLLGGQAGGEHKFRTQEDYNAFLRVAHESVAVGEATLTSLAGQQGTEAGQCNYCNPALWHALVLTRVGNAQRRWTEPRR